MNDREESVSPVDRLNYPTAAALHALVIGRIYHEDNLFAQRSYVLLAVHAFLIAAFTVLMSAGTAPEKLWPLPLLLAILGATMAIFQAAFGRQTNRAISFWREYAKLIEKECDVKFDHLLYEFYQVAEVATDFGEIAKEKEEQKALYSLFGRRTRFFTSSTNVLGVLFPLGLAVFWTVSLTIALYPMVVSTSINLSPLAQSILLTMGLLLLLTILGGWAIRPSLAKAKAKVLIHQPR